MKKCFSIMMIAVMLCMCITVIDHPAYAEQGDPIDPIQYPASQDGTDFDSWGLTAPPSDDTETVILDSEQSRNSGITPVDTDFMSADNKELTLTMTGLTSYNTDSMLTALETKFLNSGEGSDTPIKVVHDSFIDAEKWDGVGEPQTDYFYGYDTSQCWAASCSNMLWMSGWADVLTSDGVKNPRTGQPFQSEDDIFEYYNVNFSDNGCDSDRAIDWFFMGEFFLSGASNGAHTMNASAGGFKKTFVSSVAQTQHDLIENPSEIESLLRVAADDPADRSVFEVSVGSLDAGELSSPLHAMTGIGLITDPSKNSLAEKYKAIIIIDSDNDASPSDKERAERDRIMSKYEGTEPFSPESDAVTAELIQYKESRKEIRPNSYTVYKLRYSTDINGTPYWEIVNYSDNETTAIYNLDELPCPSEEVIAECTEHEGTKDVNSEVDFTLDNLFTTSNEESARDPYGYTASSAKKYEFDQGDPVNINYFLANRSNVILDDSYPGGNGVTVDWTVTRDSDGSTVASGSTRQVFECYKGIEAGAMLYLNKTDSGYEKWQPGAYTATVSFNTDGKFRESYYKNNFAQHVKFAVVENAEPDDTDVKPQDDSSSQNKTVPKKVTVKKKANTLKVKGKTIKLRAKKLRKKSRTIKRANAISVSKAKGSVTYQKVQVSKKNKNKKYIKKAKYAKKITVNRKTGKITVKKGLKKGTYKLKVKVTAAGNDKYKPAKKTVTVKIRIR